MDSRDQIAVLDLLRRREAEFVKVWQCEEGVRRLLGLSDYPFAPVPELPSRVRGHRTVRVRGLASGSVSVSSGESSPSVPSVRKLRLGEDAYHLVYRCSGEVGSSFQRDPGLLRQLFLLSDGVSFQLLRIETVSFHTLDSWEILEELWRAAECP